MSCSSGLNCNAMLKYRQFSPACPSESSNNKMKMSVQHWWNGTDRYWQEKTKYWQVNLPHCHFVHHQYLTHLPGIEPMRLQVRCRELKAWSVERPPCGAWIVCGYAWRIVWCSGLPVVSAACTLNARHVRHSRVVSIQWGSSIITNCTQDSWSVTWIIQYSVCLSVYLRQPKKNRWLEFWRWICDVYCISLIECNSGTRQKSSILS